MNLNAYSDALAFWANQKSLKSASSPRANAFTTTAFDDWADKPLAPHVATQLVAHILQAERPLNRCAACAVVGVLHEQSAAYRIAARAIRAEDAGLLQERDRPGSRHASVRAFLAACAEAEACADDASAERAANHERRAALAQEFDALASAQERAMADLLPCALAAAREAVADGSLRFEQGTLQ